MLEDGNDAASNAPIEAAAGGLTDLFANNWQ